MFHDSKTVPVARRRACPDRTDFAEQSGFCPILRVSPLGLQVKPRTASDCKSSSQMPPVSRAPDGDMAAGSGQDVSKPNSGPTGIDSWMIGC